MANENPLRGAPRIHGELLKLGFDISESTVLRHMPKKTPETSKQRWKTFLKNHSAQIVSRVTEICALGVEILTPPSEFVRTPLSSNSTHSPNYPLISPHIAVNS